MRNFLGASNGFLTFRSCVMFLMGNMFKNFVNTIR